MKKEKLETLKLEKDRKKERADYVDESLKELNEIKDSYNFTTEETHYLEDYDIKLTIENIEDVRDACERTILVLKNYLKIK